MSTSYYKGRVALVTGASAGIGAATVETLVKEGLTVIGAARRVDKIQALSESLKLEVGRLIPKKLDVCNDEDIVALYQWAEEELGGIDVVINNAGILHFTPFQKTTTEEMRATLDTNLLSVSISSREAINSMVRRNVKDGFIININSLCGYIVPDSRNTGLGVYPSSKFGVTALCKTLRYTVSELGLKTRVTSINPGSTESEITEGLIHKDHIHNYIEAKEVSKAISFVLNLPPTVEIPYLTILPTGSALGF